MSTFKRSKLLMQEDLEKRARKRKKMYGGGRTNLLEELGRVDAEKAYTKKGKRNLREEKHRIRKELKKGGHVKSMGKATRGGGAAVK